MIDIKHYVEKIKEHDEKRLSFNERMAYWTKYLEERKQDK
jgi:hypothetical protein